MDAQMTISMNVQMEVVARKINQRGYTMDDSKDKALFCEAIALLKEIAESRGQFYSEEEHTDYFKRVEDVIKCADEILL